MRCNVVGEMARREAAISGIAAFFEPLIGIVPLSGVGPSIINLSTGSNFYEWLFLFYVVVFGCQE